MRLRLCSVAYRDINQRVSRSLAALHSGWGPENTLFGCLCVGCRSPTNVRGGAPMVKPAHRRCRAIATAWRAPAPRAASQTVLMARHTAGCLPTFVPRERPWWRATIAAAGYPDGRGSRSLRLALLGAPPPAPGLMPLGPPLRCFLLELNHFSLRVICVGVPFREVVLRFIPPH